MGNWEKTFIREAETAAAARKMHPGKIAADPSPGHMPHVEELHTPAKTAALPSAADAPPPIIHPTSTEPATFRPHVQVHVLDHALEKAGAAIPPGLSAKLIADVETQLGGRTLDQINTAELAKLRNALETRIAAAAPAAHRQQSILRDKARKLRGFDAGSDVRLSAAKAAGGTWLFWHSPSPSKPVIWGESFVPTKPNTPVPHRRPDPIDAGITGTPQWRDNLGQPVPNRPAVPTKPAIAASELGPHALDAGPDLILDEVRRAQQRAADAAAAHNAPAPLKTRGVSGTAATRTGTRITSIDHFTAEVPDGEWDELIVVKTTTGKEAKRLSSTQMDKVLPPASTLPDPKYQDWTRLHAVGPITGDETLAGLAYGPHEAFNQLQKNTTEAFLRWDAKRLGRINLKAEMPVTIRQYIKHRTVGGVKRPFLRTVKYEFTLENGRVVTAIMDITPDGTVTRTIEP
jgi:hypothetical protein